MPVAAARGRAVVDEPPAARVMVPMVGLLPSAVPVHPPGGEVAGGDELDVSRLLAAHRARQIGHHAREDGTIFFFARRDRPAVY